MNAQLLLLNKEVYSHCSNLPSCYSINGDLALAREANANWLCIHLKSWGVTTPSSMRHIHVQSTCRPPVLPSGGFACTNSEYLHGAWVDMTMRVAIGFALLCTCVRVCVCVGDLHKEFCLSVGLRLICQHNFGNNRK